MRMSLFAGALLVCNGMAQTIPYEQGYKLGSLIPFANRWGGPAGLDLIPIAGSRTGKVWLRETPDGILIFAHIDGSPPHYARVSNELESGDRVGVWFSAAKQVVMPPIGWGNQFGSLSCKELYGGDPAGAKDCQSWEDRQAKYREQLRRLFVRHWELTPTMTTETYASIAYRKVLGYTTNRQRDSFAKLEPHGGPSMQEARSAGFFYFEILVPWSDFPPTNTLDLSRINIAVDFCGSGGVCSSTAPQQANGNPATFNQLNLARPLTSTITPCSYPLEASDLFNNRYEAWYLPDAAGHPSETFGLQTSFAGYQEYAESLSPVPVWTHYFSKSISEGEVVCGPAIKYVAGNKTMRRVAAVIDESQLLVRSVPGGHLVKSGPTGGTYKPLGNGECGACPTVSLSIYHLNPATGITVAFDGYRTLDAGKEEDGDIRVSADWKRVTLYSSKTSADGKTVWSSELYCLSGAKYRECGPGPSGPPPKN